MFVARRKLNEQTSGCDRFLLSLSEPVSARRRARRPGSAVLHSTLTLTDSSAGSSAGVTDMD